jgi:hypothetical protein
MKSENRSIVFEKRHLGVAAANENGGIGVAAAGASWRRKLKKYRENNS